MKHLRAALQKLAARNPEIQDHVDRVIQATLKFAGSKTYEERLEKLKSDFLLEVLAQVKSKASFHVEGRLERMGKGSALKIIAYPNDMESSLFIDLYQMKPHEFRTYVLMDSVFKGKDDTKFTLRTDQMTPEFLANKLLQLL